MTGWLTALCCVGFAAVNIAFEFTGRFTEGPYTEHAAGLTVVNWFVVTLKVLGSAVALLSVTTRPAPSPRPPWPCCCGEPSPPSACTPWAAWSRRWAWPRL